MATQTFEELYDTDGTSGTVNVVSTGGAPGGATFTIDSGDPAASDDLVVGVTYTLTNNVGGTAQLTYEGVTAAGDPVFTVADAGTIGAIAAGETILLSDTTTLAGSQVEVTADPVTVCFAEGTLIATPEGERTVETLEIGDVVTTADGRAVKVKWVGRQTIARLFAGERAIPVRVTAGALGGGLPHTDLVLTADHALILDGLAINAGALVNGGTIVWDRDVADRATYYHVETEEHDVILANGAASETYIDYVGRKAFHNYAEYAALYGDERTIREMDMPRVSAARLLPPALKARLAGVKAA